MPAWRAWRLSAAIFSAIGITCSISGSLPGNSRSLITSISSRAASALSGTLPCRSSFLAGMGLFCHRRVPLEAIVFLGGTIRKAGEQRRRQRRLAFPARLGVVAGCVGWLGQQLIHQL